MAELREKFAAGTAASMIRLRTARWFRVGRAQVEVFELRQQSQSRLQQQFEARKESLGAAPAAELSELAGAVCDAA
jgi:hypothetical protein